MVVAATCLFGLGGTAQLAGLLLVLVDVRDKRDVARVHLADAESIGDADPGIYSGLGSAHVFAEWAMREHRALRLLLADALRSESRRSIYGAGLLAIGIVVNTAASVLALA